jgi:hypothetical protein
MKRKLVAIVAMAAGAFALLPAQAAFATTHRIGGYAHECIGTNNTAYNRVYVAVDGIGSDTPLNYNAAASARVTATAGCAVANGIKVARVQIDKISLLELVGTTHIIRMSYGPLNNHTSSVQGHTGGWHSPCTANLQSSVRFSVRYVNGALSTGGFLTGPVFRRC